MRMRLATCAAILAAALPAFAVMPPVPRPAKELVVVEPSGKKTLLTSLKGKVVYIQFLFTTCPHCQHLSQVMTKVSADLAPKGLVVMGVGFDEPTGSAPGTPPTAAMITGYTKQYAGFPVGMAPRDTVMSYLGISVMDRFAVPQVLIVDRKGTVRAQSDFLGTEQLQDETYVRKFLGDLLKEGATTTTTSAAPKKAAPVAEKN